MGGICRKNLLPDLTKLYSVVAHYCLCQLHGFRCTFFNTHARHAYDFADPSKEVNFDWFLWVQKSPAVNLSCMLLGDMLLSSVDAVQQGEHSN